ncbi:MAG: hypothetical protein EAY65_00340 [Alphaproteobacteria bacterium]|nr:MAG: hypothetical protein EAY65_00340 [Alphaproteobacteria bacterium]
MVDAVESSQEVKSQEADAQGALSAERKARLEELYVDKDVTTQRIQRIPTTQIYDGVLLGVGLGGGLSTISYLAANKEHIARGLLEDVILSKAKDGAGGVNWDEVFKRIPKWLQDVVLDVDALKAFGEKHTQFGTPQGIYAQLKDLVSADDKVLNSLSQQIVNGNEKSIETLMNTITGVLDDERKSLVSDAIKNINTSVSDLKKSPVMQAFEGQAEQQINSNVITKLKPVQWVGENLGGDWKQKLGAVAAVTLVTTGAVVIANQIMNRGKKEERAELKSHLQSLNERIAKEQDELGTVTR